MTTYNPPFPPQNYIDKKGPVVGAAWLNAIDNILQGNVPAKGQYQPTFLSGEVQLTGPNGIITSYGDLTFGLSIPTPLVGVSAPTLIIGGAGKDYAQITTDAQIPAMHGINLFIEAGSTDSSGTDAGGALWLFGGGSFGGLGGPLNLQAGTSVHGVGGDVTIFGGNNTAGDAPAGNIYILAGTSGDAGGHVKIYSTKLGGVGGDISFWLGQPDIPHSVPLWTMSHTGALFPGNSGAGNVGDTLVSAGNLASPSWGPVGIGGTLNLSMSGSMTVTAAPIFYASNGRQVTLWCEQLIVGNSTGFNDVILSTLPGNLVPDSDRYVPCSQLVDNSTFQFQGMAHIDTSGGVTLSLITLTSHAQAVLNAWTAGGQKGISAGWCVTYPL